MLIRPVLARSSRRREQMRNPLIAKNKLTPFGPMRVKANNKGLVWNPYPNT
jgi:hypothetical protein